MLLETFLEMYFLWRMCLFSYVNVQKVYAVFCKCLNFYSTLLENLTDYIFAFRPFPSIWLNFTSHRALQKHHQSHTVQRNPPKLFKQCTYNRTYLHRYEALPIWSDLHPHGQWDHSAQPRWVNSNFFSWHFYLLYCLKFPQFDNWFQDCTLRYWWAFTCRGTWGTLSFR